MNYEEAKRAFVTDNRKQLTEAVSVLKEESRNGSAMAAYYLSQAYGFGKGIRKNEKEAFLFVEKAAETFAPAKAVLAFDYLIGRGVEKDSEKADRLFRESANEGCVISDMFLSENKQCREYATTQFSRYIRRDEKTVRLKEISDNPMAQSMLIVYAQSEKEKNERIEVARASNYRYANVLWWQKQALTDKKLRKEALNNMSLLADAGYVFACDILADTYCNLGEYVSAASYYNRAFKDGMLTSGTKLLVLLQSANDTDTKIIDDFLAVLHKRIESGCGYATFLLSYYYGAILNYKNAAEVMLKISAGMGSSIAKRMLELTR